MFLSFLIIYRYYYFILLFGLFLNDERNFNITVRKNQEGIFLNGKKNLSVLMIAIFYRIDKNIKKEMRKMTKETVSARIREKRKGQKITQQELADRIGVSLMTVLRWEKGERTPNAIIMPQIAEALNTSVEYLMGLQPETESKPQRVSIATSSPTMAYWGGVLDNAKKAVNDGQNLSLIYSLLADAAGTVKSAMGGNAVATA